MGERQNITINIGTGTIFKVLAVVLAIFFLWLTRDIVMVVLISIIFASLLEPAVDSMQKRKIPRGLGVILLYILILFFLVFTVRLLVPPIAEQIASLTQNFPQFWQQVTENLSSVKDYSAEKGFLDSIQKGLQSAQDNLGQAAGSVYGFIVATFRNVINFFLILVISFYLVVQRDALSKSLKAISPRQYHDYLHDLATRIKDKIGAWARGQLILGFIIGVMSFLGLIFLLPKYALVLAIVAGLTELVPYLGPILGAIPAVFLGFTVSPGHGIAVLILYIVIQQLENNIIVPQVMRKQLGLNPVVIIVAMLIGARMAGIVGLILAIPIATSISIVIKDFLEKSDISVVGAKDKSVDNS